MAVNVGKFADEGLSGFDQFFTSSIKSVGNLAVGELAKFASAGMGDLVAKAGMGSITASVVSSMASTAVSTYGGAAVNALEFSDGGFGFNKDAFKQATAGAGMAMLKSGVTSLVQSSIMVANGAKWANGKLGWGNGFGRDSSNASDLAKSTRKIAGTVSGLVGEAFNAAQGNGFSLNVLNSADIFGSGGGLNHQGLLSYTFGGKNSGFAFGSAGFDVSASSMVALGDALSYDKSKDKGAQYYLKNYQDKKGLVKLTMLDLAKDSKNAAAIKQMNDVLNGDKEIVFRDLGKGHWGHAGVSDNTIQLNSDVLDISKESLSKAGFYASVFAREGHLIDENVKAGVVHQATIEDKDLAKKLTLGAYGMQSGMLKDLAKNAGIQFSGAYGRLAEDIKRVAKNENLTGFQATGRDLVSSLLHVDENASAKDKLKHLKSIGYKTEAASIDFAGGEIRTVPGTDGEIEILFNNGKSIRLKNKKIKNGETDFSHLLSGANSQDLLKALGKGATSEGFLGAAVKSFYSQFKQGNPNASNERGSGQHNYDVIVQAQAAGDPRGLECRSSAMVHLFMSTGLIRPDMSRKDIEKTYFLDELNPNKVTKLQLALRGRTGYGKYLGPKQISSFANKFRDTDWAKLTGANNYTYSATHITQKSRINTIIDQGGSVMAWLKTDHWVNIVKNNAGKKKYKNTCSYNGLFVRPKVFTKYGKFIELGRRNR